MPTSSGGNGVQFPAPDFNALRRHDEIKAQNERIINGQMITQQLLRDLIEETKKSNELLNRILCAE